MLYVLLSLLVSACALTEADRGVGVAVAADSRSGGTCTADAQCGPEHICFNQFCVGQGALRVSLAFTVDTDFDLHLLTPGGVEIFFGNRLGEGGFLDVDQCVERCGTGVHVENIFFESAAPSGRYEAWVVNYDGRGAGVFQLETNRGALGAGELPPIAAATSQGFVFTFP